jgi:Dimethlysulfonioproprionate lyase
MNARLGGVGASGELIAAVRALLGARGDPRLLPWLDAWTGSRRVAPAVPAGPAGAAPPVTPPSAAAVRAMQAWLPLAARAAPAFSAPLCAQLLAAAPALQWRQTYGAAEIAAGALGAAFLERYAWCELPGSGAPELAAGFLLLGAETDYPDHAHEAEELYLPISGAAAWRQGDEIWRERSPGELIHHAPLERHAMRTGTAPLLALFLWRGGGESGRARLVTAGVRTRSGHGLR